MVVGLGLWGKDVHNLLIKAIQMRFDARHVTRDWKKLDRLEEDLKKYKRKHNISKIEEVEGNIDATAKDAVVHSHRLVSLDLLMLYGMAKYCEEFVKLLRKEESQLTAAEKTARGKILNVINEYKLKEKQVVAKLREVISSIKKNLQKERAIVLAMENITEGKAGVALWAKETVTIKVRFLRYMRMRFEMVGARKDLQLEEKDIRELMPILVHLDIVKEIHTAGGKSKGIAKELESIDKKENDFVKAMEKGSKNVFDLFVNDFLVMRLILLHLYDFERITEEMAREHDIPLSMAQSIKEKEKRVMAKARSQLQQERQDIKQLWDEINSINA